MGIEQSTEESESNQNTIVNISSDQLYPNDKDKDGKREDEPVVAPSNESSTEAAAITAAKMAAKEAVDGKKPDAKKDADKNANLELESSSDLEDPVKILELEAKSSQMADAGLSRQNGMFEDKSQVIEEVSTDKKDDLAVPNWPKYTDPVGQRAEIDKELTKVKKQADDFKKSSDEAESEMNKKSTNSK